MTPPIRFLAGAVGSWACVRGIILLPLPAELPRQAPAKDVPHHQPTRPTPEEARPPLFLRKASYARIGSVPPAPGTGPRSRGAALALPHAAPIPLRPQHAVIVQNRLVGWSLAALPRGYRDPTSGIPTSVLASSAAAAPRLASRWSGAAWLHGRTGDAPALAPAGSLGGSQAGARIGYRLSPALQVIALVSSPLRRTSGAEAAVGVEWQPAGSIPLRILAERRQKLGREGRDAFAVTLHGGVSEARLPVGFRIDAYAQAGAVGARSRDLFAEASIRAARPVRGGLSLGAGVWGAAQPGAARLDVGPSATLRLPQLRASLSADWRFRAAGTARPGSGPALTLWTDF